MIRRPRLWAVALRQWRRTVPAAWWRQRPFVPVPDRRYLEFRLQTQYGSAGPESSLELVGDVIGYLTWCRDWERA